MIVFGKQQISYQSKEKLDEQDSERERERKTEIMSDNTTQNL